MDTPTDLSRRQFVRHTTLGLAGQVIASQASAASEAPSGNPALLTDAEDFYTVARGNPKPHSLEGDALKEARLTEDTWRLEISADTAVDPPDIKETAEVENPLTIEAGTALNLPTLMALGEQHGVKYIKAMQCLNIAEPLGQGLWEGVPLSNVLRLCGTFTNVRRIYYRGFHNNDPKQIFQSSVSYTQAMETSPGDLPVFLAYRLNGRPIPPIRGGPVRMIVPWAHGFKSIKWLQQIFLTNDYRTNDTYALKNNDPESYLKTAAYVDSGPDQVEAGKPVEVTGQVISGLSGVDRVEYFLRTNVPAEGKRFEDGSAELEAGPWKLCQILPPPSNWSNELPNGISTKEVLGFDPQTGKPLSWPLRYGMAFWRVMFRDLKPGRYELYARSVDRNGFAQPEPRSTRRSGKNMIQVRAFEVI